MKRAVLLLLLPLFFGSGCVAVGRGSAATYNWGGETFAENPVSLGPYFFGLALGAIAGSPLLLLSWPMTEIGYPEDGPEELEPAAVYSPCALLGTSLGTVLALPFYPFGLAFMDDGEGGDEDWSESAEGGTFEGGPPGGMSDPTPPPWKPHALPQRDGVPAEPLRGSVLAPWEAFDRSGEF